MENISLFFVQLALAIGISLGVILYMRSILRSMLLEICDRQPLHAEFWVRLLDVMMVVAPVILTLVVGLSSGSAFEILKRALLLVLIGQFVSLSLVGRTLWNFVRERALRVDVAAGA